ncbi:Outer membrane receptor proteins, mostly Fe transport [Flavobacteriaceae bacterium MAR_2010_188]|nr:Outer membrane receptor proteins, mostly Fe transport [Flavobacteriaceae bacterium MAR_2010_188]
MFLRIFYITVCLCTTQLFSQQYLVNGRVVDQSNNGVAYANILLLKEVDSTVVAGTSTEEDGGFIFNKVDKDSYIISVSYLGYEALQRSIVVDENLNVGNLMISETSEDLDEVNILVKRPTLTKKPDRLTFNVASTALIEGSILQLLKSTPSLVVMDGDIKIKNSRADVYINNRKVQLSSSELTALLESAPANSIQSIEIITNPPASYDASSGAVINIIMSKNLVAGYRGDVFAKYTQGVFPQYNGSTSHFFKSKKSNIGITYSFTKDKINRDNDDMVYYLDQNNNVDEIWSSDIGRNIWSENHSINLNYDTYFDDRNTLILSSSMLFVPYFKYKINNSTEITDDSGQFLSSFNAYNLSRDKKHTLIYDLDYIHELRKKGKLSYNANITFYDYNRVQLVDSDFFDGDKMYQNSSRFKTDNNQNTRIYSSKLDFSTPFSESSNFETGGKFSFIKTESDISRNDIVNGSEILNRDNTNDFQYDEKIASAYANLSQEWKRFSLNIGLRLENTDLAGVSMLNDVTNEREYLEWFPNASILYQITDKFNIYTNYKRSIQRPSYTSLNPFSFYLNENIVVTGNPDLKPILEDKYVVGSRLFDLLTLEAYYKNKDGQIYELPRQNNETNIIYFTPVNLDKFVEYGFDAEVNFNISDRWYVYAVTSFFKITEENAFEANNVKIDRWSNYSNVYSAYSFLKDNSLNLSFDAIYLSKSVTGLSVLNDILLTELSITKTILKGKGTLTLTASDLFNMADIKTTTRYLNQYNIYDTDADNRNVSLGFRYNFGNTKLKSNEREITTEENDRFKKEQEQD